jgi:transposase
MLKQTKEARGLRRAQAVRAVVAGHPISTVSAPFHLVHAALRKWVPRFAQEGPQGLLDRARSGRPPQITCALDQHLNRLVAQDPLEHGSLYSQWHCRALATVLARETGVQLGRESVRCVVKKTRLANLTREESNGLLCAFLRVQKGTQCSRFLVPRCDVHDLKTSERVRLKLSLPS